MISIWKKVGIISTGIIGLMIPLSLLMHKPSSDLQKEQAVFVGGKECISCHQREYDLWKNSNHDNAMDIATDSSVLGDFNNVVVELNGKKHKFYKRDGKFFVYTQGVGGKMTEFQITHTFGVRPLQQYLIPFEKGKYQCLPVAWDVNKKRWFDMASMVYTKEELKPDSWFYWTNQSQNWNGMCAECHSTQLAAREKAGLLAVIEDYHQGLTPLIVPLTLIKHYVQMFDVQYIRDQVYLNPHPKELMLRNHV